LAAFRKNIFILFDFLPCGNGHSSQPGFLCRPNGDLEYYTTFFWLLQYKIPFKTEKTAKQWGSSP
jgi:hypothetical protein